MNTIFDIGMYDGADTRYYLETGHRVIAVEANPVLCEKAAREFGSYITSEQLVILNRAIYNKPGTIDLHVSGQDLGSSSVNFDHVMNRFPVGRYTVPTMTFGELVQQYGRPLFAKIDIEGADYECVRSITEATAPAYLSFEGHRDVIELLEYVRSIGYRYFKIIQQNSFRCIQNQDSFADRLRMKAVRLAGFERPLAVRLNGRLFNLCHSAGPVPWEADGHFYTKDEIQSAWRRLPHRGWYDIHCAKRAAHLELERSA